MAPRSHFHPSDDFLCAKIHDLMNLPATIPSHLNCLHCDARLTIKYLDREGPVYPIVLICLECNEVMMKDAADTPNRAVSAEEFEAIKLQAPVRLLPFLKFGRNSSPKPSS